MSDKYLPIGSICTLKSKHKKVMITSYYSVEFNGNLKINDYQGCAYPEGLLLPEFTCTFNHSDIEKVDFIGYKNEEYNKFSSLLNRLTGNETTTAKANDDWVLASSNSYSKLLFDENGVVVLAEPVAENKEVQSVETQVNSDLKLDNPFKKEYSNEVEINSNDNIFEKEKVEANNNTSNTVYKFDENGFVIAEEVVPESVEAPAQSLEPVYKFDENGFVIAEEASAPESVEAPAQSPEPVYKFDENGFVIAEEASAPESVEAPAQSPEPIYKFDENGTVIAVEEK